MKPSTPRKSRRRNQPPSGAGPSDVIPASDYESDALDAQTLAAFASSATAVETNIQATKAAEGLTRIGAMNLSVLQRWQPSIQSCIPGPPTSVYAWDPESDNFSVALGLGVLFVCDQHPDTSSGQPIPRPCIFILNRKDPNNFFFDLSMLIGLDKHDHPSPQGLKIMLHVHLVDSAHPAGQRLWGLLGDAEPMEKAFAQIQKKLGDMKAATSTLQ